MRKLKNWFVSFDTIKGGANGLINSVDYINDNNHHNHKKDGHRIISYERRNEEKILKNILSLQQRKDIEVKISRKGGRPASYGKNLLVSFPSEIKLTDEQYKHIRDKLIFGLVKFISDNNDLKYSSEQINYIINHFVLSSLHKQMEKKNDHLNFVIGNVFLDLNNNKSLKRIDLGKKMYMNYLKNRTNEVLLEIGHNYLDYQIKEQRKNRNKKNKLHHTIDKLDDAIKKSLEEVARLQSMFKEMLFLKDTSEKLEKRIGIYINRMQTALEEQDEIKFEKNLKLANKSYNKLSEMVSDDEHIKKLSAFEVLKNSIEEKKHFKNSSSSYPSPKR